MMSIQDIKEWKKKNPNKVKAQKQRWREKHKKDINKTFTKWKNKTDFYKKMRKYSKNYREVNKEKEKLRKYAYYHLKEVLIKERGFKCEYCKTTSKSLDLHHIEYNNEKNKILLLCRSCHMKIHKGFIDLNNFLIGGES